MFCKNCNQKLELDAKFCPGCGAPVENISENRESANNGIPNASFTDEKVNFKEFLTLENAERYAPAAAFLPVVMAVVCGIFGHVPLIGALLKIIFVLSSLGSAAVLSYITVKYKDKTAVTSWLAPFSVLMAAVACIIIAAGNSAHVIFGLIALVIGLETTARITIEGNPLDSPPNPSGAIETYKRVFGKLRDENRARKEAEKSMMAANAATASVFDGSGLELLGLIILYSLISMVTLGIAAPWMICKLYSWRIKHTILDGKRLVFTGTGAGLLGNWIKWMLLTIITFGIYGFFVYVAVRKWELQHTFIEGDSVPAGSNVSDFDGSTLGYIGNSILSELIIMFTIGIGAAFSVVLMQKWDTKHQVISQGRLYFDGTALGIFVECLIILLLSVITCGIYSPWAVTRLNRYIISHTHFE